jgi:hypothetical protein
VTVVNVQAQSVEAKIRDLAAQTFARGALEDLALRRGLGLDDEPLLYLDVRLSDLKNFDVRSALTFRVKLFDLFETLGEATPLIQYFSAEDWGERPPDAA